MRGHTKLDRLARSVANLMTILQALVQKRVGILHPQSRHGHHDVDRKADANRPRAVAQFEREMMLERQQEGIAKAKSDGHYKGRKPIEAQRRQNVLRLAAEGVTRAHIAAELKLGEATVYRILASQESQSCSSACSTPDFLALSS